MGQERRAVARVEIGAFGEAGACIAVVTRRDGLTLVEQALEFEWRLEGLRCDLRVVQGLQQALREGGWKVTVAVHNDNEIVTVWLRTTGVSAGWPTVSTLARRRAGSCAGRGGPAADQAASR